MQADCNQARLKLLRRSLSYAKVMQAECNQARLELLRRSLSYAKVRNLSEIPTTTDIKNERILKEFINGYTIYELALEDKVTPSYIKQIKNMCKILYPLNINIDYFPTNFIVSNELLWYIDYECNNYMEEWNFENWGIKYWSKTPELIEYYNKNKK